MKDEYSEYNLNLNLTLKHSFYVIYAHVPIPKYDPKKD